MPETPTRSGTGTDLLGREPEDLERLLEEFGEKRFHAMQLFRWIHARRARRFDQMTDLSLDLRRRLSASFRLARPEARRVQASTDGTRKYLFALADGGSVESVFMPEERRVTFCISPRSAVRSTAASV